MGKIYASGLEPQYAPDESIATRCFRVCLASSDRKVVHSAARQLERLRERGGVCASDDGDDGDDGLHLQHHDVMPAHIAEDALEHAVRVLESERNESDTGRIANGIASGMASGIVTNRGCLHGGHRAESPPGEIDYGNIHDIGSNGSTGSKPPTEGAWASHLGENDASHIARLFDPRQPAIQEMRLTHAPPPPLQPLRPVPLPIRQVPNLPFDFNVGLGFGVDLGLDFLFAADGDEFDDDMEDDAEAMERFVGKQNVHDHSVACTTRENLRHLREKHALSAASQSMSFARVREEVIAFLLALEDVGDTLKADALEVVDALTDIEAVSAGSSQLGALAIVWRAIHDITDPEVKHNVRVTLVEQLAEAKEKGKVVCTTGVISRIASVLDGVDDPTLDLRDKPRPMWVLRQEIASLAAKIQEEFSEESPERAKRELAERVSIDYVTKLGLSQSIVAPIVDEFSEHF